MRHYRPFAPTTSALLAASVALAVSGCEQRTGHEPSYLNAPNAVLEPTSFGIQQEMAFQPSYRPLRPSPIFEDGRASRPLPPGVVPRGDLNPDPAERAVRDAIRASVQKSVEKDRKSDADVRALVEARLHEYQTGRVPGTEASIAAAAARAGTRSGDAVMTDVADTDTGYLNGFPIPVDEAFVRRGQERYGIFCAMCHGAGGAGNGMIVQRGYLKPPSYLTDLSRGYSLRGEKMSLADVPLGYIYDVITNGYGGMPDYSTQIPMRDRWAIVAYVRALQTSRRVKLADLPEDERRAARENSDKAKAPGKPDTAPHAPHQEAPK